MKLRKIEGKLPGFSLHLPRPVRNILISAGILLVLFIGAGLVYIWMTDSTPVNIDKVNLSATTTPAPITPHKPAPDAREGVSVEMATSPISQGSEASIAVHTNPTSVCKIQVFYDYDSTKKQKPSTEPGLEDKTADDYGNANWTWTVRPVDALGLGKAIVTCTYNGRGGVVQADLQVTK